MTYSLYPDESVAEELGTGNKTDGKRPSYPYVEPSPHAAIIYRIPSFFPDLDPGGRHPSSSAHHASHTEKARGPPM
jgi:hypothetical protein